MSKDSTAYELSDPIRISVQVPVESHTPREQAVLGALSSSSQQLPDVHAGSFCVELYRIGVPSREVQYGCRKHVVFVTFQRATDAIVHVDPWGERGGDGAHIGSKGVAARAGNGAVVLAADMALVGEGACARQSPKPRAQRKARIGRAAADTSTATRLAVCLE